MKLLDFDMPMTMLRAMPVACLMSFSAPVEVDVEDDLLGHPSAERHLDLARRYGSV